MINKREIGAKKEEMAIEYLRQNGITILEKNYRCRQGEIDIIARDGKYLIFVEVKYRKNTLLGAPEEAVGSRKQGTICKVADYYRYCRQISEFSPIRYDVVSIMGEEIKWYQNAFLHKNR